jgi:hypothetical protein
MLEAAVNCGLSLRLEFFPTLGWNLGNAVDLGKTTEPHSQGSQKLGNIYRMMDIVIAGVVETSSLRLEVGRKLNAGARGKDGSLR